MECSCLHCGVIKNGHTCAILSTVPIDIFVQLFEAAECDSLTQ